MTTANYERGRWVVDHIFDKGDADVAVGVLGSVLECGTPLDKFSRSEIEALGRFLKAAVEAAA